MHVHTLASVGFPDSIRHRQDSSFHRERIKGSQRGSLFSLVHIMPCTVLPHERLTASSHGSAAPQPPARIPRLCLGCTRPQQNPPCITSLGPITIHKQAKSRFICSSQRDISDFPALRSWLRNLECWTWGQIPRLTNNPVEPLCLTGG